MGWGSEGSDVEFFIERIPYLFCLGQDDQGCIILRQMNVFETSGVTFLGRIVSCDKKIIKGYGYYRKTVLSSDS